MSSGYFNPWHRREELWRELLQFRAKAKTKAQEKVDVAKVKAKTKAEAKVDVAKATTSFGGGSPDKKRTKKVSSPGQIGDNSTSPL